MSKTDSLLQARLDLYNRSGDLMAAADRVGAGDTVDADVTVKAAVVRFECAYADFLAELSAVITGRAADDNATIATIRADFLVALAKNRRARATPDSHQLGFHSPAAA